MDNCLNDAMATVPVTRMRWGLHRRWCLQLQTGLPPTSTESCEYLTCAGCTDANACNYDAAATIDDGSCTYTDEYPCETCEDGGIVDNDADGDGICDADETAGCTDPAACNAGDFTDTDNSLCLYPEDLNNGVTNLDCDGKCYNDADGDGVCDEDEIPGCTDENACDFSASATDDDGSCTYPNDIYGLDYVDCDGNCLNDAGR